MKEETAEKVSNLLEERVKYEQDLSKLFSKDFKFSLAGSPRYSMMCGEFALNISEDKEFNLLMKGLVIEKLKEKISKLGFEIEGLDCK